MIAVTIPLIGFYFFDVPSYFNEMRYAVYLTPKVVSVGKSDWTVKKIAQIANNNPYPIYHLQVEMRETPLGSNIDKIVITPEPYNVRTEYSTTTNLNGFVLGGNTKSTGKKWRCAIIYKVNAHSKIDVEFSIPPSPRQERFELELISFQREPLDFFEKSKITYFRFTNPCTK